jgi:phage portal protein BeeE
MGFLSNFIQGLTGRTSYLAGYGTRSAHINANIGDDSTCAAILDTNATHIARGQVVHVLKDADGRIRQIKRNSDYTKLFMRPNPLMTAQEFKYAMAWQAQMTNTAFAWIRWDDRMRPVEIWPLVYLEFEIRQLVGRQGYAIALRTPEGERITVSMEDLVILRRKYDGATYVGGSNEALRGSIEVMQDMYSSLREAMRVSNKVHGLFTQKNAMLATKSAEQAQKDFAKRIKEAEDTGGIVALDATEQYTPLNVSTWAANAAQMKELEKRLYTYWRTPEDVVSNTASEQTMMNYFDAIVEPFWEEMGEAFTKALFTRREQDFGNAIMVTSAATTGASWATKLNIINSTKEIGLLTKNQYLELLGYPPVDDGDVAYVSLNYIKSTDMSKYQVGDDGGIDDGTEQDGQDPAED